MPTFDATASLRMWAVEVELGGFLLRIPPLPAADWLPYLMKADLLGLLELAEGVELDVILIDAGVSLADVTDAVGKLVEAAAGRSVWATLMLAGVAAQHWHVVGADLARAGVRFDQIPLGAALDAIYGSLCRSMDDKGLARFNASLEQPTAGARTVGLPRAVREAKPLPASAEQYVRERPRTQLRRPQDRPDAPTAQPIRQPVPPADGDPGATSSTPPAVPGPPGA